eukprot:tig00001164_g7406.t1
MELDVSFPRQLLWLLKLSEAADFPYRLLRLVLREKAILNLQRVSAALAPQAAHGDVDGPPGSVRKERDEQRTEVAAEIQRLRAENRREFVRASQYIQEGGAGGATIRAVEDRAIGESLVRPLAILKALQEDTVTAAALRNAAGDVASGFDDAELKERLIAHLHTELVANLLQVAAEARPAAGVATPAASPARTFMTPGEKAQRSTEVLLVPEARATVPASPPAAGAQNPAGAVHHKRRLEFEEPRRPQADAHGPPPPRSGDEDRTPPGQTVSEAASTDASIQTMALSPQASPAAPAHVSPARQPEAAAARKPQTTDAATSPQQGASRSHASTSPLPSPRPPSPSPRNEPALEPLVFVPGDTGPEGAPESVPTTARSSEIPFSDNRRSTHTQTEHYGQWLVRLAVSEIERHGQDKDISRALERMRERVKQLHRERAEAEILAAKERDQRQQLELKCLELQGRLEARFGPGVPQERAGRDATRGEGSARAALVDEGALESKIRELRAERAVSQRDLVKSRAEAEALRAEAAERQRELALAGERIEGLKKALQSKGEMVERLCQEKSDVKALVASLQGEWEEKDTGARAAQAELESRGRALERALAAAAEHEQNIVSLRSSLREAAAAAAAAQRDASAARAQLLAQSSELTVLRKTAERGAATPAERECVELRAAATELQVRLQAASAAAEEAAGLRASLEAAEGRLAALESRERELELARSEAVARAQEIAAARADLLQLSGQVASLRKEAAAREGLLEAARSEISSLEAELADRYAELIAHAEASANVERLRSELAEKQAETAGIETMLGEKDEELNVARDRLKALEARIAALAPPSARRGSTSQRAAESEVGILQASVAARDESIAKLRAELAQAQAAIAKYRNELDSREIDVAQLKSDLKLNLSKLETMKIALGDLGAENNRLMRYVNEAQEARAAFERLKRGKASSEIKSAELAERLQLAESELQQLKTRAPQGSSGVAAR